MKTSIIVLSLLLFAIPAGAETYKWVDGQGNVNYTDDLGNIPQKYRKHAATVGAEEDTTSPLPGEVKETPKPGTREKKTGETGEKPASAKEQKKTYGGKSAEAWRNDFGKLNADIKSTEDQLADLNDRVKDTSKMSRGEYLSIQMGINEAQARLQRLKGKLDALNKEADKANVPADLRGQ